MKKNDLAKNTLLLLIASLLTKGLQFLMIPFFSSWLSIENYGTFDVVCTYITLLIPLVSFATADSVFRFSVDLDFNGRKKYVTNGFFIYLFNMLFVSIIILLAGCIFNWKLAIPFLLLLIGQIFNDYFQGYLRGVKKLNIYSICMAVSTFMTALCTTVFLKVFHFGLDGIIYGYALGYIIGNLLIFFLTKFWVYICLKTLSKKTLKEMILYSFPLIFNNISWWVVNVSDRSVIKWYLGVAMNGVYAIANKIPNLCSSVFGAFSISWHQTASEMYNKKDRNEHFNRIYNKMTTILISLCTVILSANFIFFDYIFDVKYTIARYHTPILVLSIIFLSISQFLGGIQISFKRPKENGITTIIAAIVNIIVNILLIHFIGLYAASISTLISNIVLVLLRKFRLQAEVPLKLEKNSKIGFVLFFYIFVMQYVCTSNLLLSVVNFFFSCIIFVIINKEFILNIFRKLRFKGC